MDEIFKSIKAYLYDRTVSPLFGAYIMAWSVWNYKIFIALLDDKETLQLKFSFLETYFGPAIKIVGNTLYIPGWLYHGIFGPVILTFLYLYAYPRIAKPVYEQSLKDQTALRELKQAAENQRLLTIQESKELMAEIEQLRVRSESDTKSYREKIMALTEKLSALESENSNLRAGLEAFEKVDSKSPSENQDMETRNISSESLEALNRKVMGEPPTGNHIGSNSADAPSPWVATGGVLSQIVSLYPEYTFDSKDSILIKRMDEISSALSKEQITYPMYAVLAALVKMNGHISISDFRKALEKELNRIEVEHVVELMQRKKLIEVENRFNRVSLGLRGKELVISSGMTAMDKHISRQINAPPDN